MLILVPLLLVQAARSPLQPAWTRDIQLDGSNTQWLQRLPAATQAFTASWLLQHLTIPLDSLQSPTHAEPNPLPAVHCSPPSAETDPSPIPISTHSAAAENGPSSWADPEQAHSLAAAADTAHAAASGQQPATWGWAQAVGGLTAAADVMQPAAVGVPQAAERGSRAAVDGSLPVGSGLPGPAVGGLQPAASGLGGSAQDLQWQQLAQEWQAWHDDMEEWAESCCPAAEAMVSTAHAIAEARADPDSGAS